MKYYKNSPRWSYEITDCSVPLALDTYSNCSFECQYCFSFFQRAIGHSGKEYLAKNVYPIEVERIKKMFTNKLKINDKWEYIKQKKVMQWGALSD